MKRKIEDKDLENVSGGGEAKPVKDILPPGEQEPPQKKVPGGGGTFGQD